MLDVPLSNDYCFDNVFCMNMSHSRNQDLISQSLFSQDLISQALFSQDLIGQDLISQALFSQDLISQDLISQDLISQDLIDIFIVLSLSVFSLICSTLFVSNCVYKKMVNEFVTIYNSNTTLYEYDPYFYKFLDDYDLLEKHELSVDYLNSLNTKYIKETTPLGLVILTYNNEYNSFDYYCKKSTIVGFNYLEVVSRIYVVNFDCKVIYSDNYDNLIMLYNKQNGIINNDENKEKCYGEGGCDGDGHGDGDGDVNVFFTKKVSSSKKVDYYNFVSNKYKYKGTLDDFDKYIKTNNLISIEHNSIEHNSIEHNSIEHNSIEHNSIEHNSIEHNSIEHNSIEHNSIEHNSIEDSDRIEDSDSTYFFSLEKNSHLTELDELNISFKTFKSLSKVKTL
jgi:hypothetical protein